MIVKAALKTHKTAITGEFITLGQFLKLERIIDRGGEAKAFLQFQSVTVNGEAESRRGRKLRVGDRIVIANAAYEIVAS